MNIPSHLKYAPSHEWVEVLPDGRARVGISDYAQAALGDIVFVNLPAAGDEVQAGEQLTDLESVKAVAEVYSPISGVVEAVNGDLDGEPEKINADPYGAWIAVLKDVVVPDTLLDAAAYAAHCEAEEA